MIELDDRQTLPDAQMRQMLLGAIAFKRTDILEIRDHLPSHVSCTQSKLHQLLRELVADGEIISDPKPDACCCIPMFRRVNN